MITFYTWIRQFQNQENSIGDLSLDILNDPNFPKTKNYDIMLDYLKSVNACNNALNVFKKLYLIYTKKLKINNNMVIL